MDDNTNITLSESRTNSQREQHLFNLVELCINSLVKTVEVLSKGKEEKPETNIFSAPLPPSITSSPLFPFGPTGGMPLSNPFSRMSKEDKEMMTQMMNLLPDLQKQIEKRDQEDKEWKEKVLKKNEE